MLAETKLNDSVSLFLILMVSNGIAHANYSFYQRITESVIDLLPQVIDIDVHYIRAEVVVDIPNVFEDIHSRNNLVSVAQQVFKKFEFPGCQFDAFVLSTGFLRVGVQLKVTYPENA